MYQLIIVDDEYEIRSGLSHYFPWESIGFQVAGIMENGAAAMEFIQTHDVDAVLTDIEMAGMSGIDLARQIHEAELPVKVIFLSAYKKFEYARDAISYKVVHYITKPTVHSEISEVFCSVKRELDKERGKAQPQEGYYDKVLAEIKRIMEDDLKNVTLVSVAEQLGRSPSSVSRLFAEAMGSTFTDYLTGLRMERANELLNRIDYKVYEVSEMVGYTNPKNFTRAYKKYFGSTPREFRGPRTL